MGKERWGKGISASQNLFQSAAHLHCVGHGALESPRWRPYSAHAWSCEAAVLVSWGGSNTLSSYTQPQRSC